MCHVAIMKLAKGMGVAGYTSQRRTSCYGHGATAPERGESGMEFICVAILFLVVATGYLIAAARRPKK